MLVLLAATVAPVALAAGTGSFKVTSTLDGKTVLPLRIHWIARPGLTSSKVKQVDFLIDNKLGWVEHNPPYVYGDDGNWLVTSFLKPGRHTFTTRVVAIDGTKVTDTVRARVIAPPQPPATLIGTWGRVVSKSDVTKATSSQPPPAGRWEITISATGWRTTDPDHGGGMFDVAYVETGRVQLRPTIETPPYPNPSNGGWCADTDPLAIWSDAVSADGSTLTLTPIGREPCGDRAAILEGTWTRVGG